MTRSGWRSFLGSSIVAPTVVATKIAGLRLVFLAWIGCFSMACRRDFGFLDAAAASHPTDADASDGASRPPDAAAERTMSSGDASDASSPEPDGGEDPALPHQIALLGSHMCVIDPGGEIRCRGVNDIGQLGNGVHDNTPSDAWMHVLVAPEGARLTGATAIAVGQAFSCAIVGGNLMCWGLNPGTYDDWGPVPAPVMAGPFQRIEAGLRHICAADPVVCWGDNQSAQIYDPLAIDTDHVWLPRPMPELAQFRHVTLGEMHTCALQGDSVLCWGDDNYLQCGNDPNFLCTGDSHCVTQPTVVRGLRARGLGPGWMHSCAIQMDRTVACWGQSERGQSGGAQMPGCQGDACLIGVTAIKGLTGVTRLALGTSHTCALTDGGSVWCWGDNSVGQLGRGTTDEGTVTPAPVLTAAGVPLKDVVDIASTEAYTCAVTPRGTVYCWGQWFMWPMSAFAAVVDPVTPD
jgi:alpha-tubulin suppressor-like RCC1 family protein